MSVDDFDPDIERLFSRTPPMADAPVFTAQIERRLARGGRVRAVALGVAGVIGGLVTVREAVNLSDDSALPFRGLGGGLEHVSIGAQHSLTSGLEQAGLGFVDLGASGSMQLFLGVTAILIAVALAGAMRLAQDI